jgi:type 2 lantibiotic biosynthesis protein LanM
VGTPERREAERRVEAWRKLMGADAALFSERLASCGLDGEALCQLLVEAGGAGPEPDDLSWRELVEDVVAGRYADEPLPPLAALWPGEGRPLPFSSFLAPFLRVGAARLREGMAAMRAGYGAAARIGREVETGLLSALACTLYERSFRTLLLELNVARLLGQLSGATPGERFEHFSEEGFRDPKRLAEVLGEYPVLARLMASAVEDWAVACLELLERVTVDRELLGRELQDGRTPGALMSVRLGVSDPHRRGRGVALLRFETGLRVVYKPKSLAVERKLQALVRWVDERGLRCPHRVITVLDRGGYGWMEHVSPSACPDEEALRRFYWRQGSLLALLRVLSATDFHLENLIAAGEHPVLVDLEALFQPRPAGSRPESALEHALELLRRSVLAVGLLPSLELAAAGGAGMDISGLGGEPGQTTPMPIPTLEDAYEDTMRLVRRHGRMEGSDNRPTLAGKPVRTTDFVEEIVQGFEETYRLIALHRGTLASLLHTFAEVEVRFIARATQRYGLILAESLHPDFLRDGLERDRVLDHLWREVAGWPALRGLVPFEHEDLLRGDVPLFTARPGHRHVWSSDGRCLKDFLERDALGEALERLSRMDDADRAAQVALIRQSLVLLEKEGGTAPVQPSHAEVAAPPPASPGECLAGAVEIGELLVQSAILGESDATWIGLSLQPGQQERWGLTPLGVDLYDGVAGVALFLAHLGACTGKSTYEGLARAALEPVRQACREPRGPRDGVGAFTGRASTLYVLGQLGVLWNEPRLLDEALMGLESLGPLIDADRELDLLGGVAGCAVVLLGLHRRTGDSRALALARRCGERLLATAVPTPRGGRGWPSVEGGAPLAGFSHGAAGIAWALLELEAGTGEGRFGALAREALAYERSVFVPEAGNWRDLRGGGDGAGMVAWCHGAAGIALGRLLASRHLEGPEVRAELATALETTVRAGTAGSHCLCHGALGNAEALLMAGRREEARGLAARVLQERREGGWRCGLPRGNTTPGLMVGLAGIGLGLLRVAQPERVPSVLALGEAPGAEATARTPGPRGCRGPRSE